MLKILVADDEVFIRRALIKTIETISDDFDVVCDVDNAVDALEVMSRITPDLILLDIRMPAMDGLEFASRIKKDFPNTLIVFVTGYADFRFAQKAVKLGAMDYILKPVKNEILKEVLTRAKAQIIKNGAHISDNIIKVEDGEILYISSTVIKKYNFNIPIKQHCQNITIQAIQYISSNYASNINLNIVSRNIHVSKNYLCSTFKSDTGLHFSQFVNIYRLEKAHGLLLIHPNLKKYEIANMVGFNDSKYFSKLYNMYHL